LDFSAVEQLRVNRARPCVGGELPGAKAGELSAGIAREPARFVVDGDVEATFVGKECCYIGGKYSLIKKRAVQHAIEVWF